MMVWSRWASRAADVSVSALLLFVVAVVVVVGGVGVASAASKREADYTLDDSFWIDETPAGEVERLLREYTQNQEMVRNIGAHYYQIIYPVQLRQHRKMGISTRETRDPRDGPKRGQSDGGGYSSSRPRQRTGKHFHRTSLLIKAFNHKFRLDLELNTQLLAPNIMQKHYLKDGAEHVSKQEIEHCYYHGTVQDYPGATAAFHTCNGVSGVIHVGNETFVIHPFYGGDLSKHPHVIFEARTKANKGCANVVNNNNRQLSSKLSGFFPLNFSRMRRDVREATKYIETALIIDHAMFEKRNGSLRSEVVHDSIQVANIADLYFRTLNTRVSVVYIETWQGESQVKIDRTQDIKKALNDFNEYTSRRLYKVDKDTAQLLTGVAFLGGEAGMAVFGTVCTSKSVGVSVDINTYEPHLLAGTMAHMIGHNLGMNHDDGRDECTCRDWHGCIMAQSIVGLDNVQPYKFSDCSLDDYIDRLRIGNGICLLNKPNELLETRRSCGNGVVEEGEDCDCGSIEYCNDKDPCCDPITCKLRAEAECAAGPCCTKCKLREKGYVCRGATNECDLTEHCDGEGGDCPPDIFKKNGSPCAEDTGHCFYGFCPTLNRQCEQIWGYGGVASDIVCFDQFNSKGSINGHCGRDAHGTFVKCAPENVRCGSLQCSKGGQRPSAQPGLEPNYSRTFVSIKGVEHECKVTSSAGNHSGLSPLGLVRDGTPCGENLICINQTCTSIFPYFDQTKCPSNNNEIECSGNGYCTNFNKCYCNRGWNEPDCSYKVEGTGEITTQIPHTSGTETNLTNIMKKKETLYESYHGSNTVFLVGVLLSVVGGVFVVFTSAALCYRRTTVNKYQKAYVKKPVAKKYSVGQDSMRLKEDSFENASKHLGSLASFREHKMQPMKRMAAGPGSEDDTMHSGDDDAVSFIDLPHNNLKLPSEKKGILKKHGYGLVMDADGKENWGDGARAEDLIHHSRDSVNQMAETNMSQVEMTLKSLNGYHDDIIQALRTAAASRRGMPQRTDSGILNDDNIRRTVQDITVYPNYSRSNSQEKVMEIVQQQAVVVGDDDDEEDDDVPPCGPLRIRNLEDLIRQLEHHSRASRMSPSGSEDIRMSETEADRHYRQESSSACSESSHQSNRDNRFMYGRYRQHPPRLYPHPHAQPDDESIYESADHDRGGPCGETPDSESDDFIHAHQLSRWASEDTMGQPGPSGAPPREYYPSPSSSASEEPPSIARAPAPAPPAAPHPDHATIHRPKRYPEYKH